jgi:DNA polymerase-3 subunit epsilon
VVNGIIIETYSSLIKPPNNFIREDFSDIHGITPEDTKYAPGFAESYPRWKHLAEHQWLVAHNMKFDYSCITIKKIAERYFLDHAGLVPSDIDLLRMTLSKNFT